VPLYKFKLDSNGFSPENFDFTNPKWLFCSGKSLIFKVLGNTDLLTMLRREWTDKYYKE
jgi:hypothetical protein